MAPPKTKEGWKEGRKEGKVMEGRKRRKEKRRKEGRKEGTKEEQRAEQQENTLPIPLPSDLPAFVSVYALYPHELLTNRSKSTSAFAPQWTLHMAAGEMKFLGGFTLGVFDGRGGNCRALSCLRTDCSSRLVCDV